MTLEKMAALGCIVCRQTKQVFTPAELHHPLRGGRRIDNNYVLPLCNWHHRSGMDTDEVTSRHPYKGRFIARYGSEENLYEAACELYRSTYDEDYEQ